MSVRTLAVLGDPVAHSLSPIIHNTFAKQHDISIEYKKIKVPLKALHFHWEDFLRAGGWGANITTPLKAAAMSLVKFKTPSAHSIGALNTIYWDSINQQWGGDNTDGEGFLRYLTKHLHIDLLKKNILLLGAGSAASALVHAFLSSGFGQLTVLCRDLNNALYLKKKDNIHISSYTDFNSLAVFEPIDMIINATSCGFSGTLPPLDEKCLKDKLVIDLSYRAGGLTNFLEWAQRAQAKEIHDGLGMLVEQAALSFELWFNRRPDTLSVYQKMRSRE